MMEHPNKKQKEEQKKFLAKLPEELREEHARLFRFGNAAYIYHQQAENYEPSKLDFDEWLIALPEPIKSDMKSKGFQNCKGILSFTRYVMEKNDIGMELWMEQNLSEKDLIEYRKTVK